MRILSPPSIGLNVSQISTHKNEVVYIKGVTNNAYPGTAISWQIENKKLLETPTGNCSQDSSPTYVCPSLTSVLPYTALDEDNGKLLDFVAKQIDTFKNVVNTQKSVPIQIIDNGDDNGNVDWTAGKITGWT